MPTILRLLKPGETRYGNNGASEVVKEGRYLTQGFGLYPTIVNPPYTTLTAYDLNKGTIKWQIGLGDDLRLVEQGVTGTGTAGTAKGGIIPTGSGLVFVTAADRKVHVYDSSSGKEVWALPLGGPTTGSPSMFELGGRQYLLVTTSAADGRSGARGAAKRNRCTSHWHRRVRAARWIALKRRYGAPPSANFVSMPARLSRPSKLVLSTLFW